MKYSFHTRLSRLELHDSSIEKMERIGTDVIIDFDWAKLADFEEMNIGPLIVGAPEWCLGVWNQKNILKRKQKELSPKSANLTIS